MSAPALKKFRVGFSEWIYYQTSVEAFDAEAALQQARALRDEVGVEPFTVKGNDFDDEFFVEEIAENYPRGSFTRGHRP